MRREWEEEAQSAVTAKGRKKRGVLAERGQSEHLHSLDQTIEVRTRDRRPLLAVW